MIQDITHPEYDEKLSEWNKYRLTFKGGTEFIDEFLQQFSGREDSTDYDNRKSITYNPAHAKAAIVEIKNAVHQRMVDVSREGGPDTYQEAINGGNRGVDLNGNTMNSFVGRTILPELLSIGRVGVFIDKEPQPEGITKAEQRNFKPYMYHYKAEDIRSWTFNSRNELIALLLRDHVDSIDEDTGLVDDEIVRYRLLQRTAGGLVVTFYDDEGNETDQNLLDLPEIPFVFFELSQSLLKDVADYQIALLNLASSDMNYGLKSNYPFYTEQYNPSAELFHRSAVDDTIQNKIDGTGEPENAGKEANATSGNRSVIQTGTAQGRRYPKGLDRPDFINPSPEPLRVSMEKQDKLKKEIRNLVDLAVASLEDRRTSADSKREDERGKEEGLSNIGLELEFGERKIARIWSMYEGVKPDSVTIKYPQSYSLRTDEDRRNEAKELIEIGPSIPSDAFQRKVSKEIAEILIGHKVSNEVLKQIFDEIDRAKIVFIDPEIIREDLEAGLVGTETASQARGYPEGEVEKAKQDHAERAKRIAEAQSSQSSRGLKDLATDSGQGAEAEKEASQDSTMEETTADRTRGES